MSRSLKDMLRSMGDVADAVKTPSEQFEELIRDHLRNLAKEGRPSSGGVRCSQLGACTRALALQKAGVPGQTRDDDPYYLMGTYEVGNAINWLYHRWLYAMDAEFPDEKFKLLWPKYVSAAQQEFDKTTPFEELALVAEALDLGGHVDAVFLLYEKPYIGECKSINAAGFSSLTGPQDGHIWQGAGYAVCAQEVGLFGEGVFPDVMFTYQNKDKNMRKHYAIVPEPDMVERIRAKCLVVKEKPWSDIPVECKDGKGCAYAEICFPKK